MTEEARRLVTALWSPDVAALHSETTRSRLARVGVTGYQVNVCDAEVGAAMRISHFEPPIDAVLTITGGQSDEVLEVVGLLAPALAAWSVRTRAPLDPVLPTERRVDALANIAFLRKPADLPYEQWLHRWLDGHTPVAIETQSTFGYYQNIVEAPLTDNAVGVAAIVEELFPMAAINDLHAFYDTGGDRQVLDDRLAAMMASVMSIGADRDLDLVPTSRYDYLLDR